MPGDGAIDAILVVLQGGADVALRVAALGWAGRCIVLDPA